MSVLYSFINPVLRPACAGEGRAAYALVEARVEWLERKGIVQWLRGHYLSVYNPAYFEAAARRGELWLLEDGGRVWAAAVILERDDRWNGNAAPAWYVHNLASAPQARGAGALFLRLAEEQARLRGKRYLRLDCKTGARKINAYYRGKGFRFAGYWRGAHYRGNLRQKELAPVSKEII